VRYFSRAHLQTSASDAKFQCWSKWTYALCIRMGVRPLSLSALGPSLSLSLSVETRPHVQAGRLAGILDTVYTVSTGI
jgi:hypothetical protein